jgi:hypothetical protein
MATNVTTVAETPVVQESKLGKVYGRVRSFVLGLVKLSVNTALIALSVVSIMMVLAVFGVNTKVNHVQRTVTVHDLKIKMLESEVASIRAYEALPAWWKIFHKYE